MRLSIRGDSVELDDAFREYVARRLYFALGRFASAIQRVSVETQDVNGTCGGINKRCYMEVRLRGGRSTLLTATTDDSDLRVAVDRSANRMARNVARELEREGQHNTIRASDGPLRN